MPRSSLVPESSCASSTTAPAPSPNSTQVVRSFQSRMRENVSAADHQRALECAGAQQPVGGRERVDEARADRLQIERGAMVDAEAGLHRDRGRRESLVGRGRRQHDQIDRLRVDLGMRERGLRRMQAQVRGQFAGRGDAALVDAGALHDPFVGRVDGLRQLGVGEDAARQIAAAAQDNRTYHAHERLPPIRRGGSSSSPLRVRVSPIRASRSWRIMS